MRVALAQLTSSVDPSDNLELVREHTVRAAEAGAGLVVFPEAMMCSFARSVTDAAQAWDGPWASGVREVARAVGVTVIVGMFTTTGAERVTNSLLVTGPGIEARYDKIHLFDALGYRESERIAPGTEPVVVEIGGVKIGLAICYDIRFPALFTHLARSGAEVIVVPASWAPGPGKVHQWRTLATARAMDSTCFVVGCGQAPPAGAEGSRPTGVGHSLVVDPFGTVLLELEDEPNLAVVDIDPAVVARAREAMPVLRNARPFGAN
ncbi:MAG: carbon-nitrogen hydrolase family protein [Propionibacteriaceae bacterium]|nr:carbon-nitrogen hydrolase family protein [Propionibacteriaceae bacterium]